MQLNKIRNRTKKIFQEKKIELTPDEFVSYQKNNDINEECARLTHHIRQLTGLLKSGNTVGKEIDFIAQEMQRETNTIGSKVQDQTVSSAVISLKSAIEKIREQSQNIE